MTVESWVDKLNGRWTPLLFLILGIVAFLIPMFFSPIECKFPSKFAPHDVAYGKSRCYGAKNTMMYSKNEWDLVPYPFVFADEQPTGIGERTLYQYISIILILQAIFLRIPFILWKLGVEKLGIHFLVGTDNLNDNSKSTGRRLAVYLEQWIENRNVNILSLGALTIFHCFIKLLYFLSTSIHLGLLDPFLKQENETSFGSQILKNIRENNMSFYQSSPAFTLQVICDYSYRLGTYHERYTVYCTLPLNPYLEQMMAVVWWWLIFSIAATVADGLLYLFGAVLPFFRVRFVKSNILKTDLGNLKEALTDRNIQRFANDTLGEDVISFLKQVQDKENGCVVMETVTELWKIYHGNMQPTPNILPFPAQQSSPGSHPQALSVENQQEYAQRRKEANEFHGQQSSVPLLYPSYTAHS
ncbi:innexin-11-like [Saccostrea echinata]|uniref:innexin-11-like n=1 Tax=Saccostrea echinata TaxID=191078 RepID=UPI002A83AFE3|nr:innexin-11-like [Saccostrea echinata]